MELLQGDCLDIMQNIPDNSIDLIVTDPPYRTTARGQTFLHGMYQKQIFNKGLVFQHNDIDISDYLPVFYRKLKENAHCYIMTNQKNLVHFLKVIDEWKDPSTNKGFHFIKSLIWNKVNKVMGTFYMSQFEYILFLRKGKAFQINNCSTPDILTFPNKKTKGADGKNIHDTEKPIGLMQVLIENSTQEGAVVMDPFMGSGSTGVACVNCNRDFIGIELNEHYFNIATERIKQHNENKSLF